MAEKKVTLVVLSLYMLAGCISGIIIQGKCAKTSFEGK